MRNRGRRGLALAVGGLVLAAGLARAPGLRAGAGSPWALPAVGQPIAESGTGGAPAVSLDRPVVRPPADPNLRPTAFTTNPTETGSFYSNGPRPMPAGPFASDNGSGAAPNGTAPYSWRQAPTPSPVAPGAAGTPGTVMPGPPPMPGADGAPVTIPNGTSNGSAIVNPGAPVLAAPGGTIVGPTVVGPGVIGPGVPGAPVIPGVGGIDGCVPGNCCPPSCCGGSCCGTSCGDCCGGSCCGGNCCGCGDFGCCGCDGCCFNNRWFGSIEYLLWWVRGSPTPPLVTTGSPTALFPGAIGQPGTSVLFGGNSISNNPQSGFRGYVGYWLTDDHLLGIELGGFFLFNNANNFSASSFGSPVLARPFVDALTGAQSEELVSFPGLVGGTVSVRDMTRFWGAEINARSNLCCGCNYFVDGIVGFRYLGLNDTLTISENLTITAPGPFNGTTSSVMDRFSTANRFYGTQFGFAGEYRFNRWFIGGRAVIGLGVTQQIVSISGSTTNTMPGLAPVTSPGGLLAQSSNIGNHTRDKFGVIPEVGFNVGYQFTDHLRAFVGYNFLYWNSVVRPGNQIDTRVNPNLIPPAVAPAGPALPAFAFHGSDFWAQGITFGLEIRY